MNLFSSHIMVFDGGLKGIVGCCKILQGGRNDNPFFQSECRADEAWSRVWKDASHALEVLDSSRFPTVLLPFLVVF